MKKSMAMKWAKALRSGEYIKGTGNLRYKTWGSEDDNQRYCCLGVLCEINKVESEKLNNNTYKYDGHARRLGDNIKKKFGISALGWFKNLHRSLAQLNDNGTSFNKIADIIEKNWMYL